MKKFLSLLLVFTLLGCAAARGESVVTSVMWFPDTEEYTTDSLTVALPTAMSGMFFTNMWGSNTSDLDIETLLHGYDLIKWVSEDGMYTANDAVVSGLVIIENEEGDRTYQIVIKDDLYYSDGTQITAKDYVFTYLLLSAPEINAIGGAITFADQIMGIEEYKAEYYDGDDVLTGTLSGVRLLSNFSFSVTVKHEYLPFFYELSYLSALPYPISVIAPGCEVYDNGEGVSIRNIDKTIEEPVFTAELLRETILNPKTGYLTHPSVVSGPYVLDSFEDGVAELSINGYYKGNPDGSKIRFDHLTVVPCENETMIENLEYNEYDLISKTVKADSIQQGISLVAQQSYRMASYARIGLSFINFSCERPAVARQAVRQAIATCLDKESVITDYVGAYGLPADGYYGLGQWMYQIVNGTISPNVDAPAEDAKQEEVDAYEAKLAAFDELSLDGLTLYEYDVDAARALLIADGWTLNREGGAFDPKTDDVRCREIDGVIVPLDLSMLLPEGNVMADILQGIGNDGTEDVTCFKNDLASIGIALTVETMPMEELLTVYYRQTERSFDMIYLGTNFNNPFEPSAMFDPSDAYQGVNNRTGIEDETLYELALDMSRTVPGDVLTYCQKWVAFQEHFTEVLPIIPIYSNVYFDFFVEELTNYNVAQSISWADAIQTAYFSDISDEEDKFEDEYESDFEDEEDEEDGLIEIE